MNFISSRISDWRQSFGRTSNLVSKGPAAYLDYTESVQLPLTNPYTGAVDPLSSLALSVAPSGDGEIAASRLTVDSTGFLVTWWLVGGVPGRRYTIKLLGTTEAGRIFQWNFKIRISPLFAIDQLPPAPNPGFGPVITWTAAHPPVPSLIFTTPLNFGAWPFGCEVVGPGVPYVPAPPPPHPALIFDNPLNFGAWPFGCQIIGPGTPYIPPTAVPVPALFFDTAGNFGAWPFGSAVTGPGTPYVPPVVTPVPALIFDTAANFGAWPFGCSIA